jgi:pyochelin synthetase
MTDRDGSQAAALLDSLQAIGVRLWLEDSALRYRAPAGVMTPDRLAALRGQRDVLVRMLKSAAPAVLSHDGAGRFEPFPVTEVQAAYLNGRGASFPYGGVGCHGYGELAFDGVDPARLDAAWRTLIERHDMLRAVVCADGVQRVQPGPCEYHIGRTDLGEAPPETFTRAVEATRADMDHRVYQPGEWPLFDLRLTHSAQSAILHFSIDFLIADFVSIQLLLAELEEEYLRPGAARADLDIAFRDLLLADRAARTSPAAERDRAYWRDRIDDLPGPPELPAGTGRAAHGPARFRRLAATLDAELWQEFRQRARQARVTPTCAVLAAYAEVIRRWSRPADFMLNITVLNRPQVHPRVNEVVGDFTSVELLAVRAGEPGPFAGRARAVQAGLWEDLDHGLCSGVDVMREYRRRHADGLTLFPFVFTSSIGLLGERGHPAGGMDRLVGGISQTPQVWLDCQVMEGRRGLAFNWDIREGIFADGLPEVMFGAFEALLRSLATGDDPWQSSRPVPVPAAQLARRPRRSDPLDLRGRLLHDQVIAQAQQDPDRDAVLAGSRALSYGELVGLAASVASVLDDLACPPGGVVAIEMDKGTEQVPAVIGTLMSGRAFVPVDTSQPVSRRDRILADVGARAVLTQSWLDPARNRDLARVDVDALRPGSYRPAVRRDGADLAYVIYTSGSTGAPKGVMISHRAVLNTIEDVNRRFAVHRGDRILGLANLGFDLSVYDIFGPLSAGGSLVLPQAERRGDPAHWISLIDSRAITLWNSVPAQLEMLLAAFRSGTSGDLSSLRLALLSGDWIPLSLPGQARELLPGLDLISLGGATEASIWSVFHPIGDIDPALPSIPYGRPLSGQTLRVLGHDLSEVPDLVAGELWIGGAGLASGYFGDEAKTAERFIADPVTGERLYRTGDLGRYLPDGDVEFLGREDSQVKIRGHRVELAEVEAALISHPAVGAAAVITVGHRPDPIRLAAFVEPARSDTAAPGTEGLRAAATEGAAALRAQVRDDQMITFARELDAAALMRMLATLRAAGLFASERDEHTLAEVLASARVSPRHHRLVRRWLRALHDNGLIRYDHQAGRYSRAAYSDEAVVEDHWQRVEQAMPDVERRTELVSYFRTAASRQPELLSGELDPLTLLFPEGRTEIHEVAYTDMFLSRYLNRLLTGSACYLAGQHAGQEPFAVLEVGAGVGGTSVELIPALASFDVEYLFTDVSEFFLNNARRRFAEYPWVSYGRYDLNRDYLAQGLAPNGYDLVVCANVLHYARSVDAAIGRLAELVRPGGWILFIEATSDSYQIMTSMEFLFDEASGEFDDIRRFREQTFVERGQWLDVLAAAGADASLCLPEADPITDQMGMHFFAARFKSDRVPVWRPELEKHLAAELPDHMRPAQVQVVDRLPLTGNGKVDRNTLRSWLETWPSGGHGVAAGGPPAGDAELRIAAVWERLLGVRPIGRQQNFFELGGDSLLAAQVAAEIRQDVPQAAELFYDDLLRLILQNATVASLAQEICQRPAGTAGTAAAPAASPLVRLGDGPGLTVLVHDGSGTLAAFRPVADCLAGRTALIGLAVPDQAAYLALPAGDVIEEVAAAYTRALTSAGHRALRLVGSGLGGVFAAEVARQLAEVGAAVETLVVVAAPPAGRGGTDEETAELAFWQQLGIGPASLRSGSLQADEPAADPAQMLALLRSEPREDRFSALAGLVAGVNLEEAYEVFLHSTDAVAQHEPLPYAGDMTLIAPAASSRSPSPPGELAASWSEACLGDLRVIEVGYSRAGYLGDVAPLLPGLLTLLPAERRHG